MTETQTKKVKRLKILEPNGRLFKFDKSIWLFYLIAIAIFVYYLTGSMLEPYHIFQFLVITLGVGVIVYMQVQSDGRSIQFKRGDLLILVVNLIIIVLTAFIADARGAPLEKMLDTFLVASWENMLFGVIVATAVSQLLSIFFKKNTTIVTITVIIIILASVLFSIAHWKAYSGDVRTLYTLLPILLLFVALSWVGLASIGISAHFFNNLVLARR